MFVTAAQYSRALHSEQRRGCRFPHLPLARIADQVFVELSREIESQGVSRKVAVDMFGLALRTYQTRVQRLSQSQTMGDRTLWQAVLDFVDTQGNPSRASIVERFRNDGELAVGAVLNDLTTSGLISVTGKGPNALCRVTSETDRHALSRSADADSVASLLWVQIYRDGPLTDAEHRADRGRLRSGAGVRVAHTCV